MSVETAEDICRDIDPKIDEVEKQLQETNAAIARLSGVIFKDRNIARGLLEMTNSYSLLVDAARKLNDDPSKLGALRRKGYMQPVVEGAEMRAKELAVEMHRRADLVATRAQYDRLAKRATPVSIMSKKDQEREIRALMVEYKDCEQDRATRDQRYQRDRAPFGSGPPGGDPAEDQLKGSRQRSLLSAAAEALKSRLSKEKTKVKSPSFPPM